MSDKCTSPDEFGELYKSGELVWVDPDGREWVPSHAHASLTEKVERLEKGIKMAHLHLLASVCECGEPLKETDAFDCLDALLESE